MNDKSTFRSTGPSPDFRTPRPHVSFASGAALLLASLAVPALPASAADYYVATSGSNSNPGTLAQPWASINHARTRVSAGDTVWIRGGTYAESLMWWGGPSGSSWSNPVTFRNYSGETVIVRPNSGAEVVLLLSNSGAGVDDGSKYLVFQGLTFDGRNVSYDVVKIKEWNNARTTAPRYIRFVDVRVTSVLRNTSASQQGYLIGGPHVEIIGGEIDNIGGTGGPGTNSQGIYGAEDNLLVDGVHIHHINGWCISNLNSTPGIDGNNHTIRNNRIHDCPGGISEGEGTGHIIYNNVVYNTNIGIALIGFGVGTSNGLRVYNNTVYNSSEYGIFVEGSQANAIVRNNISYQNGQNYVSGSSSTVATNNLFGLNPLFVNAAAGDFRLQAGSPAIDAGVRLSEVPTDIAGLTRPAGSTHEIGAHEVPQQSADSVPTPPVNLRIVN